jgi:hypothetical protein
MYRSFIRNESEKAMRTKLWGFVTAVTILLVLGGISASLRPAMAAPEGVTHLKFLVKFIGEDTFLDLGAPGFSQGDEFILHDLVFTPDGAMQVGRDGGMCVLFDVSVPETNCTVTYALPHGDITVQFLNSPPPTKIVAVTGGTGIYRNARGQGKLVELGNETATLNFDLTNVQSDD